MNDDPVIQECGLPNTYIIITKHITTLIPPARVVDIRLINPIITFHRQPSDISIINLSSA